MNILEPRMKPTPELMRRTLAQIEILLDLRKGNELPNPNIKAAIKALEDLEENIADQAETPVDILGISDVTISALENAGIITAEVLAKMTQEELLEVPRLDRIRVAEIQGCLEVWRNWE
jgi:DNA-directed RNA polymerase alpha subunit